MKLQSQPFISFIIAAYNTAEFLGELIESVLHQSFDDYEIIVVDDGSTDNTSSICEFYRSKDSRVKVIRKSNSGQSISRNLGVDICLGKYIQFLDSDDKLPKDSLCDTVKILKNNDVDILFGSARVIDDQGNFCNDFSYIRRERGIQSLYRNLVSEICSDDFIVSPCLFIAKSTIIKEISFFPWIFHEDDLYIVDLHLRALEGKCISVKHDIYLRRIRPGSVTRQKKTFRHAVGYLTVSSEVYKRSLTLDSKLKSLLKIYSKNRFRKAIYILPELSFFERMKMLYNFIFLTPKNKDFSFDVLRLFFYLLKRN